MQTLHQAITQTANAARNIATTEHIAAIGCRLKSSLREFPLDAAHNFANIDQGSGVYYFEIQFPFRTESELAQFVKAWGSKGTGNLQKSTSRTYPKRAKQHIEKVAAGEFIPFYIGKSTKVRDRVTQHLTGEAESGTYGLKLLSRTTLLRGCKLRVSSLVFDIAPEAYFCVAFLEAALRKQLHPIVGKQ